MQQDQVFGADRRHRRFDHRKIGHAGRQNDRATPATNIAQQVVVRQGCRRHLVARRVEVFEEVDRGRVPGGGEPQDAAFAAIRIDLRIFVMRQLDGLLLVAVRGRAEPVGREALDAFRREHATLHGQLDHVLGHRTRRREFLRRVDEVHRAFLELDGIAAGGNRDVDQFHRVFDIAVMVDADLGDDEAGAGGTHLV
ncbi:MAG: hypothetical protein JWL75_425 [Parcubacteria group bacterium]|nr:hypothetical protein [Parcubacteria group bacterium]